MLVTLVSTVTPSAAANVKPIQAITVNKLAGPWAMSLEGDTGCGEMSMYVTFTLNAAGSGTATIRSHSACGDTTTGGLPFLIQSLNANGSGTANLSCGVGCGWNLTIQVSKNAQIFTAVDVDPLNMNNNLEGTAVHR